MMATRRLNRHQTNTVLAGAMGFALALAVGFFVIAMPDDIFEALIRATGLPSVLAAAAPPFGQTARTMASDAQYQSESYSQSAAVNTAQALDAIYSRAANSSNDLSGAINVNRAEGERTVEDLSRGNSIITQAAERAGVSAQDASSASRGVTALGEAGVRGSAARRRRPAKRRDSRRRT